MDEIGWTNMHLKLFFLNGFGYAADSLILALQAVTASQAALEFHPDFAYALNVAVYTGMLIGVLFWGLGRNIFGPFPVNVCRDSDMTFANSCPLWSGADVIGRRLAFNVSIFCSSIFAIVAGASPSWIVLAVFVSLAA
jgi:hypothetical protein